ncbi:MAG: MIP family channel protein [Actinomycetota bacterium]
MERPMTQRLLAEVVGTFTLIFIGAGSIVAASEAGLGVGGAGLITVALAHGLAIGVMVSAVGHVSGGHFNPAVTTGAWVARRMTTGAAVAYVVAQIAGGLLGALTLRLVLPGSAWDPVTLGTPLVTPGIADWQAIAIEAILTFLLVWVVFATALDPEGSFGKIAGLAIGFTIAMDVLMGGPFTGAAMNPARSIGPAVVSGELTGVWVYILGPVIGGTVAALLYDLGIMRRQV